MQKYLAIFLILLYASCGTAPMKDLSLNPSYSKMIGVKYKLKEEVWAFGATSERHSKNIEFVSLMAGVGIAGPYTGYRSRLKKGTELEITAVRTRYLFLQNVIEYVVLTSSNNLPKGVEIRLLLAGDNYGIGLEPNSSIYEKLMAEKGSALIVFPPQTPHQ